MSTNERIRIKALETFTLESATDRINNRCLDKDFPNLSDILGSDWATSYPAPKSAEDYRLMAITHSQRLFDSVWDRQGPLTQPQDII